MTLKTDATLTSDLATIYADNAAGDISEADLRSQQTDMIDSKLNIGAASINGLTEDVAPINLNSRLAVQRSNGEYRYFEITSFPSNHTAVNYTAANESVGAHFAGLDTAVGNAAVVPFVVPIGLPGIPILAGTAAMTFRAPFAMTLTDVRASVSSAPSGSGITVDINESGTTILSTKLTIDDGETTSTTAATAVVISDSAIADDAEIVVDVDAVGSTLPGSGLIVTFIGTKA